MELYEITWINGLRTVITLSASTETQLPITNIMSNTGIAFYCNLKKNHYQIGSVCVFVCALD